MPQSSVVLTLQTLHHIGALPLGELERRFTKPAVNYVRNLKLIGPPLMRVAASCMRPLVRVGAGSVSAVAT